MANIRGCGPGPSASPSVMKVTAASVRRARAASCSAVAWASAKARSSQNAYRTGIGELEPQSLDGHLVPARLSERREDLANAVHRPADQPDGLKPGVPDHLLALVVVPLMNADRHGLPVGGSDPVVQRRGQDGGGALGNG